MSKFKVEELPEIDQWAIKRGKCPWCLNTLHEENSNDYCPTCDDTFIGTLTIED